MQNNWIFFTAIMAGNSLKEGVFTLIDDLTTSLTVSDCGKVLDRTAARYGQRPS